ncbi:MAG: hypothetical protein GTN62_14275 [Gemmatimonadales bacterium]|nr:hypothetical protein [Gemmatimonadales bacterium]NIN13238.1 hypothetical protein [Gemmatimonadales bacterium]NIN51255.1 hypothetical protein [Gemmatimonadales bacterium]NIP08719.1 hypothetical protein [Gemmatimonadales bacterium]NIR00972.1 hypothetical protein [Gemmatimonadales bacterium]
MSGNGGGDDPKSRITVVKVQDRYSFLIDGSGDVVFSNSWGLTTFPTAELAQKAAERYLAVWRSGRGLKQSK